MDRRSFLGLVAAGVATGVAGCTGDGDGGGTTAATDASTTTTSTTTTTTTSTTTTTTTSTTTTTDDGETAEAIRTAKGHLDAADDVIGRQSDSFGDAEGTNFDDSRVRRELNAADEALDRAAGSDPTDEQREIIESLRNFGDALSALINAMVSFGSGFDSFDAGHSAVESERYETAIDRLETARSRFSTARSHLRTARDELSAVDEMRLAGEGIDVEKVRNAIEELDGVLAVMGPFTGGFIQFVRGDSNYDAGVDAMDAENYAGAASRFTSAADRFDRAVAKFEDAAAEARAADIAEMQANLERLVCLSKALRDGAHHMADAADHYDDGDTEAGNAAADRAGEGFDECEGDAEDGSDAVLRAARALRGITR